MKVAIIGSNGFIGGHLTAELIRNPEINLDLFGRSESSKYGNHYKQIESGNPNFYHENFKGIDYVFYLASETIPANSWNNPTLEIEKNLIPFINFLEQVSRIGVKRIGYLSSAGTVYGLSDNILNENSVTHPFSPYGITKLTMENYLNYYYHKYGLHYDVFRISNVYGEGQDTTKGLGLINTLMEKVVTQNKIQVFGDGKNVRNFIYVKDVAEILARFVKKNITSGNLIVNVASDDSLSLNQIVDLLRSVCSESFNVEYLEQRGSDNKRTLIENSLLKIIFPESKFTPIEEGLKYTYSHIRNSLNKKISK